MKTLLSVALSVALGFTTPSVFGQDLSHEPTTTPPTLETVVVSVQKRDESDKDVPKSMTVVDEAQLQASLALSVDDLAQLGPNMTTSQANGLNTMTLRGVGGGGRNIGFDPRVGVYMDGVYAGQAAGLAQSLFGVEQAVVLRGPQGSLFGRNSVGGAVVLTSQQAPSYFKGDLKLGLGSNNGRSFEALFGGPLSERVRGQLGVSRTRQDGVATNTFNGQDIDNIKRGAVRGQLLFDASEHDQWTLFFDQSTIDERNMVGYATSSFFGLPLSEDTPRISFNHTPRIDTTLKGVSGHWVHQTSDDYTFTTILGHRSTKQHRENDTDYSAFDLVDVSYQDHYTINSLETRVANGNDNAKRYVMGMYVANENADTFRQVNIGQDMGTPIAVPGVPVRLPFGMVYGLAPGVGAVSQGQVNTRIYALFGQVDWDVSDSVTLHLGGRVSQENKEVRYQLDGRNSGKMTIASLPNFSDQTTTRHFSPNAGVSFEINKQNTAYMAYSKGYKSGGWNLDFLNVAQAQTGFSFDDEKVDSVELGVKGRSKRWSYDVSVFEAQIDDYQVFQFVELGNGGSVLALRNASKARARGFEAQGNVELHSSVDLYGSLGLLDATFTNFPNGGPNGENLASHKLPEAPSVTATVGSRFSWEGQGGRWMIDAQASYRGDSFSGVENSSEQVLGARTIVNVAGTFVHPSGKWEGRWWVKNLTNNQEDMYRTQDFFGHDVRKSIEGRTFGMDAVLRF